MYFLLQQTINGLSFGLALGLFTIGFSLVLANMDIFHVVHAGVFTWGAVAVWLLAAQAGVPFLASALLAVCGTAALNVLLYKGAVQPLMNRRNSPLYTFIASVGALTVLTEGANLALGQRPGVRFPDLSALGRAWHFGQISLLATQVTVAAVAMISLLGLQYALTRTQFGREVVAVSRDRDASALLGIRVTRVYATIFATAGALAGVAGILLAMSYGVVTANLGETYFVLAVASMVMGGLGNIVGTGLSAALIGIASAYVGGYISSGWSSTVIFVGLIGLLITKPNGLFKGYQRISRA